MKESPLFLKSFEMLTWILNHTGRFPRNQRFVLAKRMEAAALDFHDSLLMTVRVSKRNQLKTLLNGDFHLARLKEYNRLAFKLMLETPKQYEYLSKVLDEIGKMVGAWLKQMSQGGRRRDPDTGDGLPFLDGVTGE